MDRQTGKMRVLKAVLAVDAGKAINPDLVKGQVIGGMLQGLATVLYEDIRYDLKGKLLNANFTDYKIPTALDIPDEIVPIIIEVAAARRPVRRARRRRAHHDPGRRRWSPTPSRTPSACG